MIIYKDKQQAAILDNFAGMEVGDIRADGDDFADELVPHDQRYGNGLAGPVVVSPRPKFTLTVGIGEGAQAGAAAGAARTLDDRLDHPLVGVVLEVQIGIRRDLGIARP